MMAPVKPTSPPHASQRWRFFALAGVLAAGLLLALVLDLALRGLLWRTAFALTGEEAPLGQVTGMVDWAGNAIRAQPDTAPGTPIDHAGAFPYAINVFLNQEVELAKIEEQLRMIDEAGFRWLRQEFPWEDIEVDGRGQYTDSRNDLNGDGSPDTIDAWAKYDRIVALATDYDMRFIARLSNPPDWSRAVNTGTAGSNHAPPDDLQDFVNYAVAVATRYAPQGVRHYQIWNEPNIYPEWGEQFADPVAYTEMLCRTYEALKAVDPDIVVLSAAIAPTISLDGYYGYQDLVYLQNMYDAGAGACFDILSAQAYGLFSGPTDHRMRATSVNIARHTYYRDIMVRNGDAHKPIWLSEAAWNAVLDADLPPEQIADYDRFGLATEEQAARFMPLAYQRMQEEWPWVGMMAYWFFARPSDAERDQSFYYFRMVEADYAPEKPTFTPLPVYDTMRDHIAATLAQPVLFAGTHQADHWALEYPHGEATQHADGAQFGRASRTTELQFSASGTGAVLRFQALTDAPLTLVRGCRAYATITPEPGAWETVHIPLGELSAGEWKIRVHSADAFLVDAITVADQTRTRLLPLAGVLAALAALGLWIIGRALWVRWS
jgi:polysaccharide biosynthesis protein PslG